MSRHAMLRGWLRPQPYKWFLAVVMLMTSAIVALDSSALANKAAQANSQPRQMPVRTTKAVPPTRAVTQPPEQTDPLNSPYPIPWNWILETHANVSSSKGSGIRFYRTPAVISPDGKYAAYSRIQIYVQPELYDSRVSSVMFVENLATGALKVVSASSPLANNPLKPNEAADMPGVISILIPVSWSNTGDRLLARQFEGEFSTSDASDYAVVWDGRLNRTTTIAPNNVEYGNAILLGWSRTNPGEVLFRAGELGDEQMPLWAVALNGKTVAAREQDQPVVFGRTMKYSWAGSQRSW